MKSSIGLLIYSTTLLVILASGSSKSLADDAKGKLNYIDQILAMLNNDNECQLPSYADVDQVKRYFDALESMYSKESLDEILTPDQKLIKETLMDQWDYFQRRMTTDVIRSVKKRAFLCKVESYQQAKFGSSICTQIKDPRRVPVIDHVFIKNPIVRYIEHVKTNQVADIEGLNYVIRTPILPNVSPSEDSANSDMDDSCEISSSDPLVEIPVPTADNSDEVDSTEDYVEHIKSLHGAPTELSGTVESDESRRATTAIQIELTTSVAPNDSGEQGVHYMGVEDDDRDLDRLNHLERLEWRFNPKFGSLIWPDEKPDTMFRPTRETKNIDQAWADFLENPNSGEAFSADWQKPKHTLADLTLLKGRGLISSSKQEVNSKAESFKLGWKESGSACVSKDHWINILDNGLCKLKYNTSYFKKKKNTKSIFRPMPEKSIFCTK